MLIESCIVDERISVGLAACSTSGNEPSGGSGQPDDSSLSRVVGTSGTAAPGL